MNKAKQKNLIREIFEKAKTFSATEKEVETVMQRVESHLESHPLPEDASIFEEKAEAILSPYSQFMKQTWKEVTSIHRSNKAAKYVPMVIFMFGIFLGGLSLAANYTLPGDFLYPVKRSVSEKLKAAATFGAGAPAKVEARQATERLEEARALAVKGEVSQKVKEDLKADFSVHATKAKALLSSLEAGGNDVEARNIRSEFESLLKAHQIVFNEMAVSDPEDKSTMKELSAEIDSYFVR